MAKHVRTCIRIPRYVHKMLPYSGKPANPAIVIRNTPAEQVDDLTTEIRMSGRNITMDRYFTPYPLSIP